MAILEVTHLEEFAGAIRAFQTVNGSGSPLYRGRVGEPVLRRRITPKPTSPTPRRASVPGSGMLVGSRSPVLGRAAQRIGDLLYYLVRIDAPQVAALNPAGMIGGVDTAPIGAAFEQPRHNPRFGTSNRRRSNFGQPVKRSDAALNDDRAFADEHTLMHPALSALPVADHPPVLELLDDLDRHLLTG